MKAKTIRTVAEIWHKMKPIALPLGPFEMYPMWKKILPRI
jgi:hypothetical protein